MIFCHQNAVMHIPCGNQTWRNPGISPCLMLTSRSPQPAAPKIGPARPHSHPNYLGLHLSINISYEEFIFDR